MSAALALLCGFGAGLLGAMGLGGGGLLLLALAFSGMGQLAAQGVNLVFILPVGLIGLAMHRRSGLADLRAAAPVALGGLPGVAAGALLAGFIPEAPLARSFGALAVLLALREGFLAVRLLRGRGKE